MLGCYLNARTLSESPPFQEETQAPLRTCRRRLAKLAACNVMHHTSHVTRHTSHVTRHTSHVTRHTSHVTRHTSHVKKTFSRESHLQLRFSDNVLECNVNQFWVHPRFIDDKQCALQGTHGSQEIFPARNIGVLLFETIEFVSNFVLGKSVAPARGDRVPARDVRDITCCGGCSARATACAGGDAPGGGRRREMCDLKANEWEVGGKTSAQSVLEDGAPGTVM